jgi:DNA-binding MarR family transcriptional regulator
MTSEERGAALGRVLELTVLLAEDMEHGLGELGLTGPRAHLLWELQQRGPSTQQTLARALGVTPRNVTGLVDALESTGFLERRPHPTDRRASLVTFTEHGRRIAEGFEAGRAQLADVLFEGMPGDQFEAVVNGLDRMLDRLRAALAAARDANR